MGWGHVFCIIRKPKKMKKKTYRGVKGQDEVSGSLLGYCLGDNPWDNSTKDKGLEKGEKGQNSKSIPDPSLPTQVYKLPGISTGPDETFLKWVKIPTQSLTEISICLR